MTISYPSPQRPGEPGAAPDGPRDGRDRDLGKLSMAELGELAHTVGIPSVEHMRSQELIEAIRQQRETNAVLREEGDLPLQARPSGSEV